MGSGLYLDATGTHTANSAVLIDKYEDEYIYVLKAETRFIKVLHLVPNF